MRIKSFAQSLVCLILGIGILVPATAQTLPLSSESTEATVVPSRVIHYVNNADLVSLTGNVHPMAQAKFDKGRVDPGKLLERIVLVLKRSPEQEAALAAFNERQYNPKSPDFHNWLHAEEFGKLYGPSDADINQVTIWLQNHGFKIDQVGKGRVWIEFTGTVKQVENAFHVEMHHYLVEGKMHIANDRDPAIPEALFPVVTGIASLHDFRPRHFSHPGNYVKRNMKTGEYTLVGAAPPPEKKAGENSGLIGKKGGKGGVHPEFGYVDSNSSQREELGPYDVATIYNILPLWNGSATGTKITGAGVKVAIVGLSDVNISDFNLYRSSFSLPAGTLTTLHSGADPGLTDSQMENTEDTEMVSATAPGATVVLVADVNNATTDGLITAVNYIVDNEVAPIMTVSYGACELALGTAGNSLENQTFQQAATAGISSFVASGDSGSAVCTSQNGTPPYADSYGLAVSGMASNPYVTAVGGTDLQWPFSTNPYTDYWNATNDSKTGASAKGYMPEMSWNDTCTNPFLVDYYSLSSVEEVCNDAISQLPGLVEMGSGSGGVSNCTTNSTTASSTTIDPSSCSGGYAKPSWQKGVTGIPVDGKRDIPDVSMFAAYGFQSSTGIPGSALLICESVDTTSLNTNGCDYSDPDYIIYQENGGTSAASPLTAGIMAMVVQKTGKAQGLANPVFYSLAAKENYAACDSNTVAAGNACIFYDTTTGSNAAVCITGDPDCVTSTSGDQAGILSGYSATTGYDLTTGLGSFNVTNLVKAWPTATAPAVTLSPTSLTFTSTNVGATTAAQLVTVKNSGTAALTLTSETITGTNASSFVKSATTCGSSLAAGASCTVSVAFKPLAAGALSATLSIADNATGSPQTAKLSGTGVAVPLVTLSPTSLTFASTNTGSTTAAQLVTVKNSGTAALTLTSETITGTNASSFVKSATTCGSSLAAGASCTVSVAFKPLAAGALTAALSIADNATGSPQTAKLSGTGVAASGVTVTPSSIAFPATVAGVASDAQIVTVKNTGSVAATLNSIVLGGLGASSFQQIGTCGKTLAAGASCSLYVAFKPASAAALSATITVTDSVVGSPEKVTLTGTGTAAPTVKLSAKSLSFPTTPHGTTSAAQAITLTNSGTATLSLSSITLTGTNPADFEALDTCGATLVPAANCTVYVAFKPAAAAAYKATLSIADSGASSPQTVALSGTGN